MSEKIKTSDFIIKSIIILILSILSQYNVPAYIVSVFVIPALVSQIICIYGIKPAVYTGISSLIFTFISVKTIDNVYDILSVLPLIVVMVPGFVIGYCFKSKKTFSDMMVFSLGFEFAVFLAILAYLKYINNINITFEIQNFLAETFTEQFELIGSVYPNLSDNFSSMENEIFSTLYVTMPGLIPFCIFIITIPIFLIKYAICKNVCGKYLIDSENFLSGFDSFTLGKPTTIAFFVFVICFMLSTTNIWTMIFLNAVLFVLILYVIVAISVIDTRLKDKIRNSFKRYLALVGVFFISFIASVFIPIINPIYIFIIIGILDGFFDFRKLKTKKGDFYEKK